MNKIVPGCALGLWVLLWFCLQVPSFWVVVPSEVYFCFNFLSISWKLALCCSEQHPYTKLVANSWRAEGTVYFFCCGCSYDLFSHLKDYSLGKSGTLQCEKQNRRKCCSYRMKVCLLQASICAKPRSFCLHSPTPVLGLAEDGECFPLGEFPAHHQPAQNGAQMLQNISMYIAHPLMTA